MSADGHQLVDSICWGWECTPPNGLPTGALTSSENGGWDLTASIARGRSKRYIPFQDSLKSHSFPSASQTHPDSIGGNTDPGSHGRNVTAVQRRTRGMGDTGTDIFGK